MRYWAKAEVPINKIRVGINVFNNLLIKSKKQNLRALPILISRRRHEGAPDTAPA
jgi:hypothetical protein